MSKVFWTLIVALGWTVGLVLSFVFSNSGAHPLIEYVTFSLVLLFIGLIVMIGGRFLPKGKTVTDESPLKEIEILPIKKPIS